MKSFVMFPVLLWQQMENAEAERDIYDELLTQAELQGNVNRANGKSCKSQIYLAICLGFLCTAVTLRPFSNSE